MNFENVQRAYRQGYETTFRNYILSCQSNKRGWVVKNVVARGLHIPHLALTILSTSVKTVQGIASGVLSVVLVDRVQKINRYADVGLEALASFLPHIYNDILGIVNPTASFSEEDMAPGYLRNDAHSHLLHINKPKIGPMSFGDQIRDFHKDVVSQDRHGSVIEKVFCRVVTIGFAMASTATRTAELAVGILFMPLDVLAVGSHKSLHNLVVRGLRAPAIIGDIVAYTRTVFSFA